MNTVVEIQNLGIVMELDKQKVRNITDDFGAFDAGVMEIRDFSLSNVSDKRAWTQGPLAIVLPMTSQTVNIPPPPPPGVGLGGGRVERGSHA